MNNEQQDNPEGIAGAVEKLRGELDNWLSYAVEKGEKAIESFGMNNMRSGPVTPTVDLIELDESIIVQVDLPGLSAESVELSITGNVLTIEGEKPAMQISDAARIHVRERSAGRFSRATPLPTAVDPENISAQAKDGVLTVTLAKLRPKEGQRITINVSS